MGRLLPAVCALASLWGASAAAEPVRCASLNWEPYVGPESEEGGWAVQVAREAFAHTGTEFEVDHLPWPRALKATREGEYDCIMPIYVSAERSSWLLFSRPILASPVGFYARQSDQLSGKSVDELVEHRLGLVRGYVNDPVVDDDPRWMRELADTDQLNLRKLAFGRVDLVFVDLGTAQYLLSKEPPGVPLEALSPLLGTKELHLGFPIGARGEELQARFDSGLTAMAATGRLQQLRDDWRATWPGEQP
ncbi:MAG: transporter substrate-binding domain-containing protein [Proteobacteria bacterium]|nr:transporter substrate-binding domain-containing protein [Pseudomonadota bacterium]